MESVAPTLTFKIEVDLGVSRDQVADAQPRHPHLHGGGTHVPLAVPLPRPRVSQPLPAHAATQVRPGHDRLPVLLGLETVHGAQVHAECMLRGQVV